MLVCITAITYESFKSKSFALSLKNHSIDLPTLLEFLLIFQSILEFFCFKEAFPFKWIFKSHFYDNEIG